jgi:hypothetical protein
VSAACGAAVCGMAVCGMAETEQPGGPVRVAFRMCCVAGLLARPDDRLPAARTAVTLETEPAGSLVGEGAR